MSEIPNPTKFVIEPEEILKIISDLPDEVTEDEIQKLSKKLSAARAKNDLQDAIKNFADTVCEGILHLPTPPIKFVTKAQMRKLEQMADHEGHDTLAAFAQEIDADGNAYNQTIYILKKKEYSNEDGYLVAHELRHYWQYMEDPEVFFDDGMDGSCTEKEAYHRSRREIDANAFAAVACKLLFGEDVIRTYNSDKTAQYRYDKRLKQLQSKYKNLHFEPDVE